MLLAAVDVAVPRMVDFGAGSGRCDCCVFASLRWEDEDDDAPDLVS